MISRDFVAVPHKLYVLYLKAEFADGRRGALYLPVIGLARKAPIRNARTGDFDEGDLAFVTIRDTTPTFIDDMGEKYGAPYQILTGSQFTERNQ